MMRKEELLRESAAQGMVIRFITVEMQSGIQRSEHIR